METIFTKFGVIINILPYYSHIGDWEKLYKSLNWTSYKYWMRNKKAFEQKFKKYLNLKLVYFKYLISKSSKPFFTNPKIKEDLLWVTIKVHLGKPLDYFGEIYRLKYVDAIEVQNKML